MAGAVLWRLREKRKNNTMKTKTLLAMGLCAVIGLTAVPTTTVFAAEHEHEDEHSDADGKVKIPATVEGIFKSIHEYHHHLGESVKGKKLTNVHHLAFAIRDLAKALPAKATADKKKRVEGTVKNIGKLADDLDESGDANDQAKTEANLKKLDGLLKMLHMQFGMKMEGNAEHKH